MQRHTDLHCQSIKVLLLALCNSCIAATPSNESSSDEHPRSDWFLRAMSESRSQLDVRCSDHVPLALMFTKQHDVCIREANLTIEAERKAIFDDALSRCIARRQASCCFSKITNNILLEATAMRRCNQMCDARLVGTTRLDFATCVPEVTSPRPTTRSPVHTAAVEAAAVTCVINDSPTPSCMTLGSQVEREYCSHICDELVTRVSNAVEDCRAASASSRPDRPCASLAKPPLAELCATRCAQR